ncbi:MAG TPA: SPFH domain-containing protein [Kofleriaceae bacterium]|jgi:flotillin|nr:SPFH domain-containing protein [Kofleriaceae bacterium]
MRIPPEVFGGISAGIAVLLVLMVIYRYLLRICRPNEILIFSGRKHTTSDGRVVGYRVVFGGRGVRVPIVETVHRMDVSLISVPIAVTGAYSEGGIPLNVHAIANIKVSTDRAYVGNAIERFLGKDRNEIARVVKETLEGHLRGVLATLTPEELNEDRLKFARQLEASSGPDLEKLGLELDVLKIQHVSDDRNYLESIGRQRIAEILRSAEVAESDAARAAEQSEAGARARGEVAMTNAKASVQRKGNELRQIKAEVDAEARGEEVRAEAAGQQARAEAELALQQIRGELEQLRLQAEVTIPAEVDAQVRELAAAGQAASIAADGEAQAASLAEVAAAWRDSGGRAMDMFVLQHLDQIFGDVARAATRVKVEQVNLIDGGDGKTIPSYAAAFPATVAALLEQVTKTLGIDIAKVITGTSTSTSTPVRS